MALLGCGKRLEVKPSWKQQVTGETVPEGHILLQSFPICHFPASCSSRSEEQLGPHTLSAMMFSLSSWTKRPRSELSETMNQKIFYSLSILRARFCGNSFVMQVFRVGDPQVQGLPGPQSEFEMSVDNCKRTCHKIKTKAGAQRHVHQQSNVLESPRRAKGMAQWQSVNVEFPSKRLGCGSMLEHLPNSPEQCKNVCFLKLLSMANKIRPNPPGIMNGKAQLKGTKWLPSPFESMFFQFSFLGLIRGQTLRLVPSWGLVIHLWNQGKGTVWSIPHWFEWHSLFCVGDSILSFPSLVPAGL